MVFSNGEGFGGKNFLEIKAFSPGGENRLCGFFESKNFGVCNAFFHTKLADLLEMIRGEPNPMNGRRNEVFVQPLVVYRKVGEELYLRWEQERN